MKLSKREELLVFFALLVACMVLLFNYVYMPITKENSELQNKSTELAAQIDGYKVKEASIKEMQTKIDKLEKELTEQFKDIPVIWDQPELLYYLEKSMDKLCESDGVDFYDPVDAGTISAGEVGLKLKADNEDLQKLWKEFEKGKYFNTIKSFNVSKNPEDTPDKKDKNKELEVNMILRFYTQGGTQKYPDTYEFTEKARGKKNVFSDKKD